MTKLKTRVIFLLVAALVVLATAVSVCAVFGDTAYAAEKAINSWKDMPVILSWQYGDTENSVSGQAEHGDIQYTYYVADASNKPTGAGYATLKELYDPGAMRLSVGTYVVRAVVPETEEYTGLETLVVFKVLKGVNRWKRDPSIVSWDYGKYNESTNRPRAEAVFGVAEIRITNKATTDVYYKYEIGDNSVNKLSTAPAGWYEMRVTVSENKNYNGMTWSTEFRIYESQVSWRVVPNIQGWTEGDEPNDPVGEAENYDGKPIQYLYKEAGKDDSTALPVRPTAAGSYVMIATANAGSADALKAYVSFSVASSDTLKVNEWKVLPRIDDWAEGDTPSNPVGEAKAGTVSFSYKDADGEWLGDKRPEAEGEYILVATAFDQYHEKLENEYGFKITAPREPQGPVDNRWTVVPNIQGWVKGDVASAPIGKAEAGTVNFMYKNAADDEISAEIPTEIGEYVLIATVDAEGYNDLAAEVAFRITPPVTLEEHDNTAWMVALLIVSVVAVLLCSGYIAIVLILQKRGISLFGRKSHANDNSDSANNGWNR